MCYGDSRGRGLPSYNLSGSCLTLGYLIPSYLLVCGKIQNPLYFKAGYIFRPGDRDLEALRVRGLAP